MILISHRGNISGKNPKLENTPAYIDAAIKLDYSVEVDVRVINSEIFLGHDGPDHEVEPDFLLNRKDHLWIHCKNTEALTYCLKHNLHCFYHNTDDYTMTSFGYVWSYPGLPKAGTLCISAVPDTVMTKEEVLEQGYFGICSDYVLEYTEIINSK